MNAESKRQTKVTWEKLQLQTKVFSGKLSDALGELGIFEACKDLQIDHIYTFV